MNTTPLRTARFQLALLLWRRGTYHNTRQQYNWCLLVLRGGREGKFSPLEQALYEAIGMSSRFQGIDVKERFL